MRSPPRFAPTWPTTAYALITLAGCAFAFVGLARSSYWTDELFTLFLVNHHQGLGEVLRRALTDTHPPAYYVLLYGWTQLFGLSETPARMFSALCAVAAVVVFYFGVGQAFRRPARMFAAAVAATSFFWFFQAQNVRNYALSLLLSAALLAAARVVHRRWWEGRPATPALIALFVVGVLGAATHFYVFVEVGLVYLALLATIRRAAIRRTLVAMGLAIGAGEFGYIHVLLGSTRQNLHDMWFQNDPLFLLNQLAVAYKDTIGYVGIGVVAILLANAIARARSHAIPQTPEERDWAAGLCGFTHLGMIVVGLAVSLILAPSFSSMNVATAAPAMWALLAWLYDLGAPDPRTRAGRALAIVLVLAVASHLTELRGRFLPRNEEWRASARFVQAEPSCAGQPIPVVLPFRFGGATPFFRDLAQRDLFGRYDPDPGRLRAYLPAEIAGPRPDPGLIALYASRAADPGACPVLAWAVHDVTAEAAEALRRDLQRRPELAASKVVVKTFSYRQQQEFGFKPKPSAFVFLINRPAGVRAPAVG
jgi:hypothetical protein